MMNIEYTKPLIGFITWLCLCFNKNNTKPRHEHRGHEHRGHEHSGHEHSGHEHRGHEHRGHEHPLC